MSVIRKGFETNYNVVSIDTIKPGSSGKMEGGQEYSASVKFYSRNVVDRMDPQVGLKEVETTLEFVIPCATNDEAALVSEALRKLRSLGSVFTINGDLPVKYDRNQYPFVKSFDSGAVFLETVESITKIKSVSNPNIPSVKLPNS